MFQKENSSINTPLYVSRKVLIMVILTIVVKYAKEIV